MAEKEFKIIASGTPATGIGVNTPENEPAEPATAQTSEDNTEPTDPPTGNGEPPKTPAGAVAEPPKETPVPGATPPASEPSKPEPAPAAPPKMEDALKAMGFDEQFIHLAKQYQADGNINRYVQAASVDYSTMSPEQILRVDLQKQYPGATAEELDLLFDAEVKDKYKLDADLYPPDGKDAKAAAIKMKMDADKIRAQLVRENEAFKLPSRDLQAELQQQQQAAAQQAQARNETFLSQPYSKSVIADKKIVFKGLGPGIPDFNLELDDPQEVAGILTDPKVVSKYLSDGKGNTDPEAAFQVSAFMRDRIGFIQKWINYGKTLGKDELIEEKHNPPRSGTPAAPAKETLAEAIANRGRHGRGG